MDFLRHYLLTIIIFLPAVGALVVLFGRGLNMVRWMAVGATLTAFLASLLLVMTFDWHAGTGYAYIEDGGVVQMVQRIEWIKPFNIQYLVGIDGLSLPLVLLTTFISVLACVASWNVEKMTKRYMVLLLLLETGILGLFLSLDFFLFFVFFEATLAPIYFLIAIWGGPRRESAAMKFFLYSLLGSIALLIALMGLYLYSRQIYPGGTFDLVKMAGHDFQQKLGPLVGGLAKVFFVLLMVGFLIRLAAAPLHSWLLDAHGEAPAPVSMMLGALLLSMGGYGIFRVAYPLFPEAGKLLWMIFAIVGAAGIIYGALCAMAQTDFNRLVTYSSVSQMGFVVLGAAMMTETAMNGALFMMVAHGITIAAMFFIVGIIQDRARHREMSRLGGLWTIMPIFSGLSAVNIFSGMGLPGLCGFIAQVMVLLGSFQAAHPGGILYNQALAHGHLHGFLVTVWTLSSIACFSIVLTAGYWLRAIQQVFLGGNGPENAHFAEINHREMTVLIPLTIMAIVLGILPMGLFLFTNQTVAAFFAMLIKSHG